MTLPPRLVLDTNAALDVLWFADPRCASLREALEARRVIAVTNAACMAEWRRVLRYPVLRLSTADIARLEAAYSAMCVVVDDVRTGKLPRCRDCDDQMFLELARDTDACALLTRDAELLRLRKRVAFWIVQPGDWRFA